MGFEYQFLIKDMGLEFPSNLLIFGKSSSKIRFAETKETVSESIFSLETNSFLEIVQAAGVLVVVRAARVLVEIPSVLTFKSERIFSIISRVSA